VNSQKIIEILQRGTSLACGQECNCINPETNIIGICRDEITENGKTCMYRCIQLAIKTIKEGEQSEK